MKFRTPSLMRTLAMTLLLASTGTFAQVSAPAPWQVAGRQGLMLLVIVPAAS